jgi:hypothetical protein
MLVSPILGMEWLGDICMHVLLDFAVSLQSGCSNFLSYPSCVGILPSAPILRASVIAVSLMGREPHSGLFIFTEDWMYVCVCVCVCVYSV